jgi:serine O-acetyltransferase
MASDLIQDLSRYAPRGARVTLWRSLCLARAHYGLQALVAYRLGRWLLQSRRSWVIWPLGWVAYYALSRYARAIFDIRLHLSASIGRGLYIGHFGGIELTHCHLGAFCSIAQSVRITAEGNERGPDVGDRVWIGAHATIQGPCTVGTGSTISAGSVVARDVPRGALCMGDPARVVMLDYDNRRLLDIRLPVSEEG